MIILQKTYEIATIVAVKTNHQGDVYTVETRDYEDVVIVAGDRVTCSCHEHNCPHIAAVSRRRARIAEQNARRDVLAALFDLNYAGDVA
jgi:hypothetical protein